MSGADFLDTNVRVYAHQFNDPEKQRVAQALVGLHFYDCLNIAAPERGGCERIWSERLECRTKVFRITVVNPFN
jgi:predicted nucleic acid-binding protein